MKTNLKIILLAFMLGGIVSIEFLRMPMKVQAISYPPNPTVTPTMAPTLTPSPTPIPTYNFQNVVAKYNVQGLQREYADYIWAKWAPHGNEAQAVALCTNIAEGHLDDSATGYNADSDSYDRGCWQFSSLWNPQVTDEQARDCRVATDIAYNKWSARGQSFEGYWYGYGSRNYQLCMATL